MGGRDNGRDQHGIGWEASQGDASAGLGGGDGVSAAGLEGVAGDSARGDPGVLGFGEGDGMSWGGAGSWAGVWCESDTGFGAMPPGFGGGRDAWWILGGIGMEAPVIGIGRLPSDPEPTLILRFFLPLCGNGLLSSLDHAMVASNRPRVGVAHAGL